MNRSLVSLLQQKVLVLLSQEQELICHEVKHIVDHSGYHMEINGHRKFDITEPEINNEDPI